VNPRTVQVGLAACLISCFAAQFALAEQAGVKRTDLQRHDLSIPGREVVQALVELAPGEIAPNHSHPGEEIIYVLQGVLEYTVEGRAPVTLRAGEVLFVPYGAIHSARNVGAGNAVELATYVVEKGKPLLVPGRVSWSPGGWRHRCWAFHLGRRC
jgi:quercetin dioxygenase-like cupin family protein